MRNKRTHLLSIFLGCFLALCFTGCSGNQDKKIEDLQNKVIKIEGQVAKLEQLVSKIDSSITVTAQKKAVNEKAKCPDCKGSGVCKHCNGTGNRYGSTCPSCRGNGRCSTCEGSGKRPSWAN
ncbi:MAG: hypothetical protein LWX56_00625 [Ignavibacteria bacterium]|nr:hypothetical protein [Ignavibacteria bacterium]